MFEKTEAFFLLKISELKVFVACCINFVIHPLKIK